MKFILAKKLQMTQIFEAEGRAVPVTLVQAGPCFVTQVKTKDGKDGYSSVQIAFGEVKKISKPKTGHLSKIKNEKLKIKDFGKYLREFRVENTELKLGDEIKADIFKEGDEIKVIGISKGKGFQGVVKRHGFKGGPASHGQKDRLRAPGSIGSTFPERVIKGMRMAGRMGADQVTVEGLKIAKVDAEENIIAIKGAVPGNRGALLEIIGT